MTQHIVISEAQLDAVARLKVPGIEIWLTRYDTDHISVSFGNDPVTYLIDSEGKTTVLA